MNETNQVLAEAGLKYEAKSPVRYMVEVLIKDFGYEALKEKVTRPLDGLKIAGYVGCQTNRPFGIDGESYENPMYLDKLVETLGADPLTKYGTKFKIPIVYYSQLMSIAYVPGCFLFFAQ